MSDLSISGSGATWEFAEESAPLEESRGASNDLFMRLGDLVLRPGAHRRVSFRATPGAAVEIRVRAIRWLTLDVLNGHRGGPTGDCGPVVAPPDPPSDDGDAPDIGLDAGLQPIDELARRADSSTVAAFAGAVARRRPLIEVPSFDGILELPPLDPEDPIDPLPEPTFPVDVVVSFRDGEKLGEQRLHPSADSGGTEALRIDGINRHEIVDVTFINPTSTPIRCLVCNVRVTRTVATKTTSIRNEMLLRAFNGALRSLSPTLTIEKGRLVLQLEGEIAKELDISYVERDLGLPIEGGVTFEPTDLRIMSLGELARHVTVMLQTDIAEVLRSAPATSALDSKRLVSHRESEILTDTFVDKVIDAYFAKPPQVRDKVTELSIPTGLHPATRNRLVDSLGELLQRYPLLTDENRHDRSDPGFALAYRLREIFGELGPIRVDVDPVHITALLAFTHYRAHEPAPSGDLRFDRLTVGRVRPSVHFRLDISDFDVEIEAPVYVHILSFGTYTLAELIIEQGGEEILDFFADKAEDLIPRYAHSIFESKRSEYGRLATDTFTMIADREHFLHRTAANQREIAIATIDPAQLRVPHDPEWGSTTSAVEGIDEVLAPVSPIDFDGALSEATVGPSPDDLLNEVDHLVFIMMENRSFDHMLGWLSHPNFLHRSDVDGLDGQSRELGGDFTGTRATPLPGPFPQVWPNLPHVHRSIMHQINDGMMNGFASEYSRRKLERTIGLNPLGLHNDAERPLRFYTPDILYEYDWLANQYAICDRWFSSVPAGTYPNRACYYSGVTPALTNDEMKEDFGYLDQLTLFDILDYVGVDWRVFESDVSFLRVFRRFRLDQDRIRPIAEISDPLPPVTFIDPSFTGFPSDMPNNDDQPPTDIRCGQLFIHDYVERIMDMSHAESTVILITYDEHGGFADHVPPPGAPNSSHPPINGKPSIPLAHPKARYYGVRVPAIVVSPMVRRGSVVSKIFDHASVFRTVLQRFAPQHVNSRIIPERVRRARHLGEFLSAEFPEVVEAPRRPLVAETRLRRRVGRARVVLDGPPDDEDLAAVMASLGKPTVSSMRGRARVVPTD